MDKLFKVNSIIALFPYDLPQSDKSEVLKLGSTLGSTLSLLSTYFNGL